MLRLFLPQQRTTRTVTLIHLCAELVIRFSYPAQASTLFVAGLRALQTEDFGYLGGDSDLATHTYTAARAVLTPTESTLAIAEGELLNVVQAAEFALSTVYLPHRLLPTTPPPELRIFLFNHFRVIRNGHELTTEQLKQNFCVAIYHLRRALGRAEWIIFDGVPPTPETTALAAQIQAGTVL